MTATKLFAFDLPNTGPHLGVVTARAYQLSPSRRAHPIAIVPRFFGASATTDGDDEGPFDDSNVGAVVKPFTDVLLRGTAHTRGRGTKQLETGIEIGAARKLVRAIGDRMVRLGWDGELEATEPEAFERMDISWSRAYGGRDRDAEARTAKPKTRWTTSEPEEEELGAISYPRNRWGKGFFVDLDRPRLVGLPLPNLEDPTDPVTPDRLLAKDAYDWIDRPIAACYLPADILTFPRAAFFILPEYTAPLRSIHELSNGALTREDLSRPDFAPPDLRLFNAAPAGLAGHRLQGNERLKIWNLHPRHELLECDLPADRPRISIEPPGCPARELESLLQTILVEPDEDRVTLTWAARMRTAVEFPDESLELVRHSVAWPR